MNEQTEPSSEAVMSEQVPKLMRWPDLLSRPLPSTPHQIIIGDNETDIVDLWLPDGDGPHPVVLMIHGGCWQKSIADRTLMNYAAEALRKQGVAVWNIEYRGVDEAGGGFPGTFQDVAHAADALRANGKKWNLDTQKVVAYGHSAGGHLAAWLSVRSNLSKDSPLYRDDPLPIHAVVNVGGLADLEVSAPVTLKDCLPDILDALTGMPSETRANVFSDTSPVELFPGSARQISVNGADDHIAPAILGKKYTERALANKMDAEFVLVKNSGHVELIAPGTQAFTAQSEIILDLVGD